MEEKHHEVIERRKEHWKNLSPEVKEQIRLSINKKANNNYKMNKHYRNYMKEYQKRPEVLKDKREYQYKKNFGLTLDQYNEKIKNGCVVCGFKTIVHLHHTNGKKDNDKLIALCPNHHLSLHLKHIPFDKLSEIK